MSIITLTKQRKLINPAQTGQQEGEITPAMIDAGLTVLRDSGFLERHGSADASLVQMILESALKGRPASRRTS